MTQEEQEQATRDMLDECYSEVIIGGLTFSPSQIVEELDPIAFNCMLADMKYPEDEDEDEEDKEPDIDIDPKCRGYEK